MGKRLGVQDTLWAIVGDFFVKIKQKIGVWIGCTLLCVHLSLGALTISEGELLYIADKMWDNESHRLIAGLVTWDPEEGVSHLGIGRWTWSARKQTVSTDTFPQLLAFFKERKVKIPFWLHNPPTIWDMTPSVERQQRKQLHALQNFLGGTVVLQAECIVRTLQDALMTITTAEGLTTEERERIQWQVQRLAHTTQGKYALMDYIVAQGTGLNAAECYYNQGWGLKQVLLHMDSAADPLVSFTASATTLLQERVERAPKERHQFEASRLPGWLHRLASYATS